MQRNKRFLISLSEQERSALTILALDEGVSCTGVLRQMLRREAHKRGLLPLPSQMSSGPRPGDSPCLSTA
jgi:hypothetical protein